MSTQSSTRSEPRSQATAIWVSGTVAAVLLWFSVYWRLEALSAWAVSLLPVAGASHLGDAAGFFVFEAPKVLMLLTLVVFGMGVVRSFFSPERTRALLSGRREGVGNVAAAGLGVFTPFCSCSAVPLFVGFVSAGAPLGVTFSFLIAAPMVNEVALGLLLALAGWKVAATYLGFGLMVAIVDGSSGSSTSKVGLRNGCATSAPARSIHRPIARAWSTASGRAWKRFATSSDASGSGCSSA
jgi:uncharacterized membrane protein YraQ (UPF0718 family)